jgi:hypothetical protein
MLDRDMGTRFFAVRFPDYPEVIFGVSHLANGELRSDLLEILISHLPIVFPSMSHTLLEGIPFD